MTTQPEPSPPSRLHVRAVRREVDASWAFDVLFAHRRYAFWLDSGAALEADPARAGRYSLLGSAWAVLSGGFDALEDAIRAEPVAIPPELPAELACGWVGYFAYEPESSRWLVPDRYLIVDHLQRQSWWVARDEPEWPVRADEAELARRPRGKQAAAPAASVRPGDDTAGPVPDETIEPWLVRDRARYLADIEHCLAELRAGNSYEICLTNTVAMPHPSTAGHPVDVYRRLRRASPAPYAACLKIDDTYVLSASPERFLTVDRDRTAESRPIKGTAARSTDPDEDEARAKALAADDKTRAENLMIVDLVRNDLGRVCEPGTVAVPSFLTVERYATVHQLVSTIRGRLRPGVSAVRAAEACFPPGSMTGAPKQSSMRIIDGLERRPRGVYAGALGWFGLAGTADLAVVIRTAVMDRGAETVTIGAGGAIVLDSDPEEEYAEMLLKAAVPFRALIGEDPVRRP